MSFPLDKLDLEPLWRGLYQRQQQTLNDPTLLAGLLNAEFYQGTLRTRGGSQVVNGWGAYSVGTWLDVNGGFDTQGLVNDASGFRVGDVVTMLAPGSQFEIQKTITAIVGNQLTLQFTTGPVVPQTLIYVARGLTTSGLGIDVPGLHVVQFRDGVRVMVAMGLRPVGSLRHPALHVVGGGEAIPLFQPTFFSPHVARTTVAANWPSQSNGLLTSVQGIQAGDRIAFLSDAVEATVLSVVPGTGEVVLTAPLGFTPTTGAVVTLFPVKAATGTGRNAIFTGFANWLYAVLDGYAPIKYGHVAKTTLNTGWSTTSGTIASATGFAAGDMVLIVDTLGAQSLREIQTLVGTTVTLATALPFTPLAGSVIRNARVFRVGIKPPVTAPVAALGAAGTPIGARTFRVKFKSSLTQGESEPSPASNSVNPASQQVNLTAIPVSLDPQVDLKDVYSTTAGGDGLWYYVETIPNSQTTYTFNKADSALGSLMREFLDHTPPDTLTSISPWPQALRLIAIDGGSETAPPRIVFSDGPDLRSGALRGEAWPADNFLLIGLDSGDTPVALAPFFDSVLVFCQRSIWRISGVPPALSIEPVNYRADNTGIGTFGPRAVVVDQNEVLFPGQDGFYLINRFEGAGDSGFQSSRISREIDGLWALMQADPTNRASLPQLHATFFRQRRQLRAWIPLREENNALADLLVFHFDGDLEGRAFGWSRWQLGLLGVDPLLDSQKVQASAVGVGDPDTYYVVTRAGAILAMDVNRGTADPGLIDYGGRAYLWGWSSTPLMPGGSGVVARGRYLDFVWQTGLTVPSLQVAIYTDFGVVPVVDMTIVPPGLGSLKGERLNLLARGQYHAFIMQNATFNTMVELQRMAYWFQRLPVPAFTPTVVQTNPTH